MRFVACIFAACASCGREPAPPPSAATPAVSAPPVAASAAPPAASPATALPAPSHAPDAVHYEPQRTLSRIDARVARRIRGIAARAADLRADVFAKVGDSVTVSDDFFHCFAEPGVEVEPELRESLAAFRAADAGGLDPFRRLSLASGIGWSAWQALSGAEPPLAREVAAIRPRFAIVQFGTNDIEIGKIHHYADRLFDIVEWLEARGVVPVLSSIMPRRDRAEAAREARRYAAVIRGVAQSRRVPLVDWARELEALPDAGLGPDGIHPSVRRGPRGRAPCDFSADGLRHGYAVRNLWTLRMLDRVRRVLVDPAAPLDEPARGPSGSGTAADPLVVASLPLVDSRSTLDGASDLARYGCAPGRDLSGPEIVYRIEVAKPIRLRVGGFDRGGEADLLLLREQPRPDACVRAAERELEASLEPGRWFVVVDSVQREGRARSGGYVVVISDA